MTTTDPKKAKGRQPLAPLTTENRERIEQDGHPFVGIVEPPPPYQPGSRRKLPSWAKHLRDLRPLKLVE